MHGWHDVILHYAKYAASVNLAHIFENPLHYFERPRQVAHAPPQFYVVMSQGVRSRGPVIPQIA